uniref:Disks large-associated protein 5 n=1 Tax=Cyanoderma ruficeps TaxID=181631 RepID=A0A8C3R9W0_9PASS
MLMAATSQFASRYKKNLSTEALRAKVARRKSILQKENRHKLFEKGRHLGLADVNVQLSKERGISDLKETRELSPDAATKRMNERREMLQRYKEEKELRKLQEQREKAKKGVFKVGLYRPAAPAFLAPAAEEPAAAPAFSGRITRSKAKIQEGKSMIPTLIPTASKSSTVYTPVIIQPMQTHVGFDDLICLPMLFQVVSSKHEVETNAGVDPGVKSSAADSKHSMPAELQEEQTSVENNNFSPRRPRTRSFAPQNFVFQPLSGLATYTVTPMSPSRANAFLTPSAQVNQMREHQLRDQTKQLLSQQPLHSRKEITPQPLSKIKQSNLQLKDCGFSERNSPNPYFFLYPCNFRNILRTETERLLSQCLQWEGNLELDIPEDGKSELQQALEGGMEQREDSVCKIKKKIKNLQKMLPASLDKGYSPMYSFAFLKCDRQIEDVDKKFDNVKKLQDNEWHPPDIPRKAVVKKKAVPSGASKPKVEAAARTAARTRLASAKAAMRDKMKQGGAAEGAQQERLPEAEKVVSTVGFFKIESPVKNFSGR